jgi:hypothetical protein
VSFASQFFLVRVGSNGAVSDRSHATVSWPAWAASSVSEPVTGTKGCVESASQLPVVAEGTCCPSFGVAVGSHWPEVRVKAVTSSNRAQSFCAVSSTLAAGSVSPARRPVTASSLRPPTLPACWQAPSASRSHQVSFPIAGRSRSPRLTSCSRARPTR